MADSKPMDGPPAYSTAQYPPGAYSPPQAGYPPQQAGYPPQQAGYPPPQAGYPPQQAGYAPQPQGYGPPPQGYGPPPQGYNPGYAQPQMSQQSTNVVVVGGQQPGVQTVVVQRRGVNHVLHFIITLFFWPWIIVWIILCITDDS